VAREKELAKELRGVDLAVDIKISLDKNWLVWGVKVDQSFIFSRWQSALD